MLVNDARTLFVIFRKANGLEKKERARNPGPVRSPPTKLAKTPTPQCGTVPDYGAER